MQFHIKEIHGALCANLTINNITHFTSDVLKRGGKYYIYISRITEESQTNPIAPIYRAARIKEIVINEPNPEYKIQGRGITQIVINEPKEPQKRTFSTYAAIVKSGFNIIDSDMITGFIEARKAGFNFIFERNERGAWVETASAAHILNTKNI